MESVCSLGSPNGQVPFTMITDIDTLPRHRCSCIGLHEEFKCWKWVGAESANTVLIRRPCSPLVCYLPLPSSVSRGFYLPGLGATQLRLESTRPLTV